ncbi:hypothetical protein [Streptomyces lavendofoliae]|uniref:hypothetical protein n=1 Tax=Streptomyces lavendofoliae TaxID=67314 RepID=UPI003D8AA16F
MYIPGYVLFLAGAFGLGHLLLYRDAARLWALRGLVLTGVMGLADGLGENLFLFQALGRIEDGADPDVLLAAAARFALLKWTLAVPLAVTAAWILVLLLARLRRPQKVVSGRKNRTEPVVSHAYDVAAGGEPLGRPRCDRSAARPARLGATPGVDQTADRGRRSGLRHSAR